MSYILLAPSKVTEGAVPNRAGQNIFSGRPTEGTSGSVPMRILQPYFSPGCVKKSLATPHNVVCGALRQFYARTSLQKFEIHKVFLHFCASL
jgi:hypothetical protein